MRLFLDFTTYEAFRVVSAFPFNRQKLKLHRFLISLYGLINLHLEVVLNLFFICMFASCLILAFQAFAYGGFLQYTVFYDVLSKSRPYIAADVKITVRITILEMTYGCLGCDMWHMKECQYFGTPIVQ